MYKILVILGLSILWINSTVAQRPQGSFSADREAMQVGRFFGKIVDEDGKGVSYATVSLYRMQFDSTTQQMQQKLISGQITDENGDFSLEKLPVFGEFNLSIAFLGYAEVNQKVSFGLTRDKMREQGQQPGNNSEFPRGGIPEGGANNFDIDLGNILLIVEAELLNEVEVVAEATQVQLSLDKKTYRVDKDPSAAGGTAIDALKNVPSLAVDLDGNLSLRNGSPQLFVDGRPTTLSLDQIASDQIESVEVITNPSAKYDASGGQSGIVNIVMKKENRIGYNGNVRAGFDTQGSITGGGDINLREGKVNVFASGNYSARRGKSFNDTDRQNLFGNPLTNVFQKGTGIREGYFANARAGFDWFMDNRNTITVRGSITKGQFGGPESLNVRTDSLFSSGITYSEYLRTTDGDRDFQNAGGSILFKHIYPKKGKELTADINFNHIEFNRDNKYQTDYITSDKEILERQSGIGGTNMIIAQTDYVNPLTKDLKLEMGARASIRKVDNDNYNYYFNYNVSDWVRIPSFTDEYTFTDNVYAGYFSLSHELDDWGYQVGLRAESSQYEGILAGESTFQNDYPLSLFPSIFVTKKLNEEDNLQFSVTRRINRPNFFQLIPFIDYSDSLNLRKGNPDLVPEFTSSVEASYQNIFKNGHNILVTLYYKRAKDLITNYQISEMDPNTGREIIYSTFNNSNSSEAYGLEFTSRNQLTKGISLSSNINLYNSKVDATNIEEGLINEQFTWFVKENMTIQLPKAMSLQISGQYQSKTAFSPNDGEGRFRGHHGSNNTAQGYSKPFWFVDLGLRVPVMKRKGFIIMNVSDIFATRRHGSYSESSLFIQESERWRNPQVFRVNFSYRFGKTDSSLFKRRNIRENEGGDDMMGEN